ncbi:hypothetical protein ES707_13298 [subsurface metagenome]
MTELLAQLVTWINVPVNVLGKALFGFIAVVPGWLSNTIISAVAGVVLLVIFKYTSNQRAIGKVRDDIKAHMLALKLFKDSISVTLRAQGRIFRGAFLLLFYSIRPMLFMIVPVVLLLSQLGLWYQSRPLLRKEEALVTMKLSGQADTALPDVGVEEANAFEIVTGPVRVAAKREVVWQMKALEEGEHTMRFRIGEAQVEKEFVVGEGFNQLSTKRPGWKWTEILMHPKEEPFGPDSPVQSISIDYPDRSSWTSGTDWWVVYFFIASMVFALLFKPVFKVRI